MTRASSADTANPARLRRGRATPHRLVVLGSDTGDTVAAVGGLLYDRASGGWAVEVYQAEPPAGYAYRILGVPCAPLPGSLDLSSAWPDALIVSAEIHRQSKSVRTLFAAASRGPLTEVALWGGDWPRNAGPEADEVEHRLSTAALAFKAHAMTAAGQPPSTSVVETFRSGR